jgi:hypothetical protein
MSKPPRTRPTPNAATTAARRKAPTYQRLTAERYSGLDADEQRRHDAHLDLDAICDAVPFAELDRRSHGWPGNLRPRDGSRCTDKGALNAVESWSQKADPASEWLTEYAEVRAHITRLANLARYHFGFDPEKGRPENGRPAPRRNTTEMCVWCSEPVVEGRDANGQPLTRRVDQKPIHASPCYWTAATAARRAGVPVAAYVVNNEQRGRNAS